MKHVVIIGHRGALGHSVERLFLRNGWAGLGIDSKNSSPKGTTTDKQQQQGISPVNSVRDIPESTPIDAVVCVAGAFEMNKPNEDPHAQLSRLWAANVDTSLAAADFATRQKAPTLILTGAKVIHEHGSSWALNYGMCKAAVHHLALSLFEDKTTVPNRRVVCILPTMLDTPANRASMPTEDFSKWTSTDSVAQHIFELCSGGQPKGYDPESVFFRV